jgi:hypothetical protein
MDLDTGLTYLHLGQLDAAETSLAAAARAFQQSTDRREGVPADINLALVHVRSGDAVCGAAVVRGSSRAPIM